ncbi:MarR family transcriptional regulator [Pseudoroseomonas rhizosphaerae]|uniref:MarR family transcriptional regulator n=1 Tax=Teichococcus rhizosphaerae TaxID=1335062 RepID=A0A2C6Z9F8_9PROT|nr:MarR family transcriptional regulator [Pseudoroseomonas rhizosphaerae]PHK95141.1 MarR family transcriptional regulator [Pseudoroseomonas rhizosphaerae]
MGAITDQNITLLLDAVREQDIIPQAPSSGYSLDESVGHLLRRAHQRHASLFQDRGAIGGLTSTQFATLLKLGELGRATQNALGRAVALDPATIQGVVARLRDRGLVDVARDPLDRRTVVLSLAPAGETVLAEAMVQGRRANEQLLAPLAPEERRALIRLLHRLLG